MEETAPLDRRVAVTGGSRGRSTNERELGDLKTRAARESQRENQLIVAVKIIFILPLYFPSVLYYRTVDGVAATDRQRDCLQRGLVASRLGGLKNSERREKITGD